MVGNWTIAAENMLNTNAFMIMHRTTETAPLRQPTKPGKYLTFSLGQDSYGVNVLKIREIIRWCKITEMPQMPYYIKGLINLRGKVLPVVDLRVKFRLPEFAAGKDTCILVAQIDSDHCVNAPMGLIVDRVEEVTELGADDIQDLPDSGGSLDAAYILGMAKVGGAMKTLLDIDRVVSASTMEMDHAKTIQQSNHCKPCQTPTSISQQRS